MGTVSVVNVNGVNISGGNVRGHECKWCEFNGLWM